jgi:hypothetical protein
VSEILPFLSTAMTLDARTVLVLLALDTFPVGGAASHRFSHPVSSILLAVCFNVLSVWEVHKRWLYGFYILAGSWVVSA